jgi:hypothetical protein
MKQTAVEWLIDQMFKQGYFDCNKPLTYTNLDHLQQQAKEMEKEQIIDAHTSGMAAQVKETYSGNKLHPPLTKMDGKEYYNQTFKPIKMITLLQ